MPLLYIQCKNVVQTTDLTLEEEDEEGDTIEGYNDGELKNTLLSTFCRLALKDCEHEAEDILAGESNSGKRQWTYLKERYAMKAGFERGFAKNM
jgi:hypothetical protein